MPAVIEAQDVSKRFILRHNATGSIKERFLGLLDRRRRERAEEFWALHRVSARIDAGESVGVIGRNGSGKSTFLKLIAGIHRATSGRMLVRRGARIGAVIELGVGFHAELTGRENLFLNAAVHGLSRRQIEAVYPRAVEYSGLHHFMNVPLKNYSSGMIMRLGFSIAINLDPDVLLIDEIFAVGDVEFQTKCVATMQQLRERGKTIVFVSHAQGAVSALCERVCLLDGGRLVFDGTVDKGFAEYHKLRATTRIPDPRGPATQPSGDGGATREALARTPWHRAMPGGRWAEGGAWVFDFLRREGLAPGHYLLDVGCGSLSAAIHLLPYLDQSHYWAIETDRALLDAGVTIELAQAGVAPDRGHLIVSDRFELSDVPYRFDFAIAHSLVGRLPLNEIARVVRNVMQQLTPNGRFYVTWFESSDANHFEPIDRDGLVTHPDVEPYHYPFGLLAHVCEALGARAHKLEAVTHPRGESVMVVTSCRTTQGPLDES